MKRHRTKKQIETSRRNAQKSTGPNTETGRAVSRWNALKHGICSREVVIPHHHEECPEEFAALHRRFCESLLPVGPVEEMLVDQIVTTHWRMRRAMRAESGEIALRVAGARAPRDPLGNQELLALSWSMAANRISAMERSAFGNISLELLLGETRASVEKAGQLTDAALNALMKSLGGQPNRLTRELDEFRHGLGKRLEGLEPAAYQEMQRKETLAWLDEKAQQFADQSIRLIEEEQRAVELRTGATALPSRAGLEKILRYETKLERQLYRALTQLERWQRIRQGEHVPPPMQLEVAERD